MGKEAVYCKSKRTYTNECDCEDSYKCPHYCKQGLGSLVGGTVSNVDNTSVSRTTSSSNN